MRACVRGRAVESAPVLPRVSSRRWRCKGGERHGGAQGELAAGRRGEWRWTRVLSWETEVFFEVVCREDRRGQREIKAKLRERRWTPEKRR